MIRDVIFFFYVDATPNLPPALLPRLDLPSTDTNHGKELFENALQTQGNCEYRLCISVWSKNILKMRLFESDELAIMIFPVLH